MIGIEFELSRCIEVGPIGDIVAWCVGRQSLASARLNVIFWAPRESAFAAKNANAATANRYFMAAEFNE